MYDDSDRPTKKGGGVLTCPELTGNRMLIGCDVTCEDRLAINMLRVWPPTFGEGLSIAQSQNSIPYIEGKVRNDDNMIHMTQ